MRLSIFVGLLFGRYSSSPGYCSVFKALAGVRGAYAGRTQNYGESTQYAVSFRTISSRIVSLWGFVEVFAVVEVQVKMFSSLDSDERKVFREASCCLVSSGML